MRSGFGRYAQELRATRGLSQKDFAEKVGMSLARVSNIEFQRTSISDDVVATYIFHLGCNGDEAHELRKLANFSEKVRKAEAKSVPLPPLQAMLESFGDRLSPKAVAQIQQILERESGERVEALRFTSSEFAGSRGKPKTRRRPILSPKRFAEIAVKAGRVRADHCGENDVLSIGRTLEQMCSGSLNLDYRVLENMPSFLEGAFACIAGGPNGHTLFIEEDRLLSAENGVHFARHVVGHEIGHHFLHPHLLDSDEELFVAPQRLSQNLPSMMGSSRQIEQIVDSVEEVEAEVFATFFLVPWEAFLKGTTPKYLARDYGEQQSEIERYHLFFKQERVLDEFRQRLWDMGERSHPIFTT